MKKVSLTQGHYALVDDQDYARVSQFSWQFCNGYARRTQRFGEQKRTIYMHRMVMGLDFGDTREVDHINHNRLDNRRRNLRLCTGAQNRQNNVLYANNKSGFVGVSWDKENNRWVSQISRGSQTIKIGRYDDPEDAARAYDRMAIQLHGRFASTNFPRQEGG